VGPAPQKKKLYSAEGFQMTKRK